MMLLQYTAAALASENKVLVHPASADSIPTSANQEDHVSMGAIAARHARDVLDNVERILALELVVGAQALDLRLAVVARRPRRGGGSARAGATPPSRPGRGRGCGGPSPDPGRPCPRSTTTARWAPTSRPRPARADGGARRPRRRLTRPRAGRAVLEFLAAGIVLGLAAGFSPGPLMALVLAQSIRYGTREGLKVAAAPLITDVPDRGPRDHPRRGRGRHRERAPGRDLPGRGRVRRLSSGSGRCAPRAMEAGRPDEAPRSWARGAHRQRSQPTPVRLLGHGGGAHADPGLGPGAAAVVAFLAGFYACLVGAKCVLAIVAGRSGGRLRGGGYRAVMLVLGVLLLLFAALLAVEGLRLLGIVRRDSSWPRTVCAGRTDPSAAEALSASPGCRTNVQPSASAWRHVQPRPPGSSGPAASGVPSAGAIRTSGTQRDALQDPVVGGGRREAAGHDSGERHRAAQPRDDPGPDAGVAASIASAAIGGRPGRRSVTRSSSRMLRYQSVEGP